MRITLGTIFSLIPSNKLQNNSELTKARLLAEATAKHLVEKNSDSYKNMDLSTLQVDPYGYSTNLNAMEYIYSARKLGWEKEMQDTKTNHLMD